jgi:hypothetical protein
MFHPHQDAIAENGCMGVFDVIPTWMHSNRRLSAKNS